MGSMNFQKIKALAHDADQYPELDKLVDQLTGELSDLPKATQYQLVRDVLVGLTIADLRGHISVGDEHEWASAALRAHEKGLKG